MILQRGLSVVELIIVVAMLAVVAAVGIPYLVASAERSRVVEAVSDVKRIELDVQKFRVRNGALPASLADVGHDDLRDPWGQPYVYSNFDLDPKKVRKDKNLHPINSDYDLYSIGADGETSYPLTASESWDDVVRANDGEYVGLAADY